MSKPRVAVIALQHPNIPNLYMHGLRGDTQDWCLPGGHLNPGETPHDAAHRELEEETGLSGLKLQQVHSQEYPEAHVTLFHGIAPENAQFDASNDPDQEFVTSKFLDPHTHGNLKIPKHKNILIEHLGNKTKKQPFKKSEELTKSLKIKVEPFMLGSKTFDAKQHDFIVSIHKGSHKVGFLAVTHKKTGIMPINLEVDKQHRRKGYGTALVSAAEKVSGKQLIPSPDQTPEAVAFHQGRKAKLVWSQKNKPFGKSESLEKMGAAKRLFPFNPRKDVDKKQDRLTTSWVQDSESREKVPPIQGNPRNRALLDLHSKTKVRKNPDTGEREFLLHRGVHPIEHDAIMHDGSHSDFSSWTPNHKMATNFAKNYLSNAKNDINDINDYEKNYNRKIDITSPKVLSSWIPESKIHNIPKYSMQNPQSSSVNVNMEHEVIVVPHKLNIEPVLNTNSKVLPFNKSELIKKLLSNQGFNEMLAKAAAPDISNSTILFHPISFGNISTRKENNFPIHMTVKAFGSQADTKHINQLLDRHSIHKPIDTSKISLMPHKLKGFDGTEHHVLLVYGLPNKINQIREETKNFGPQYNHFVPHISVDKETWDKFSKLGESFPASYVHMKIHPAELKTGHTTIKTF